MHFLFVCSRFSWLCVCVQLQVPTTTCTHSGRVGSTHYVSSFTKCLPLRVLLAECATESEGHLALTLSFSFEREPKHIFLCITMFLLVCFWHRVSQIIGIVSYLIATCFMMLYEVAVDTIFICFLVDEECNKSEGVMSASLGLQVRDAVRCYCDK